MQNQNATFALIKEEMVVFVAHINPNAYFLFCVWLVYVWGCEGKRLVFGF